MEEQKIAEIRRFSLEMLDILDWYYQEMNARNARAYEAYLQKRRKSCAGIFGYVLSCIGKAFMVAIGNGHWVDFETFSAYKERTVTGASNHYGVRYAQYLMRLGTSMPEAIRNTRAALETDDALLKKFYQVVMEKRSHQDVVKPFIWAILACNVNLPFVESDWNEYFDISRNVVSRDMPGLDYVTRIRNAYREHDERMKQ